MAPRRNDLHRAATYSIFPQIQKEIAAMKLPASFFTPSPRKPARKTLRKATPVRAAPSKALPKVVAPSVSRQTHPKKFVGKKLDSNALKNKFNLISSFRFKETLAPSTKAAPEPLLYTNEKKA